nr:MAG TPA: hypothetical protein [Caudoviricetes sp.]
MRNSTQYRRLKHRNGKSRYYNGSFLFCPVLLSVRVVPCGLLSNYFLWREDAL